MADPKESRPEPGHAPSFWSTMPGIISALAALLTAGAGLIAALSAAGLLAPATPTPAGQALIAEGIAPSAPSGFATLTPESAAAPTPALALSSSPTSPPLPETIPSVIPTPESLSSEPVASTSVTSLEVELVTGSAADAGTTDEITLSLGEERWQLHKLGSKSQSAGGTQRYTLPVAGTLLVSDLGELKVCKEKGKKDPWQLSEVTLYVNGERFQTWTVNQWLDEKESDLCWQE